MNTAPNRRRANVLVVTSVGMTMLLGFGALALDVGNICSVQSELQRNADAAALAGASALISDNLLKDNYDPMTDVVSSVQIFASNNETGGVLTEITSSDIVVGHLTEPLDPNEGINTMLSDFNAVEVSVRRDKAHNGAVPTLFGRVLGVDSVDLDATATAIIDDRFAGFANPQDLPGPLMPFTISRAYYEDQLTNGPDDWTWNPVADVAENTSDGIREVWIYPEDNNSHGGGGGGSGGGNFGTLNIGLTMQGNDDLGLQIVDGVTSEQLIDEVGTDVLMFQENGQAITYDITGNPGISGGITPYVEQRIGDVIAFFIHDGIVLDGSTAIFTIADIRFGRLMYINLTGNPKNKRMVIQPVIYNGGGIIMDPDATSSGGTVYSLRLSR